MQSTAVVLWTSVVTGFLCCYDALQRRSEPNLDLNQVVDLIEQNVPNKLKIQLNSYSLDSSDAD